MRPDTRPMHAASNVRCQLDQPRRLERSISCLVGYIRYHNADEEIVDSAVISMFDLLYREYN